MSMTFWMTVATTYAGIIVVGFVLGSVLAHRFPRRNGSGGTDAPAPTPYDGPSFGLDELPPLGSEFDRALLPGAFDGAGVTV
jgi:hypothetical protein